MNEPGAIQEILVNCKTIAVIGLTDKKDRPSFGVSSFMQSQGYRIIPVNPLIEQVLGETAYPSLDAACAANPAISLVDVFRAPQHVPAIVDDVIRLKIPYLWLQQGVVHPAAAARAEAAGVKVVMDRCILQDRMAAGWGTGRPGIGAFGAS